MLTFKNGFQEHGTAKTSDAEGTRFATVPQIGMSGVLQVIVGVVGHAVRLVGNHTHFCAIKIIVHVTVKIVLDLPCVIT